MSKREIRKNLRDSLGFTGESVTIPQFESNARQLWTIDDAKSRISHQIRGMIKNTLIKKSPRYDELLALMRDRDADKKEVAKQINDALEELGFTEADITELRDVELATNITYQALDIAKCEAEKMLLKSLEEMNIWNHYLKNVRGIGILTASKLLYEINGITRFNKPSKLVKYCGLAVNGDGVQRQRKGQVTDYKPSLKALLLGVIGDNFIKSNSQYRVVYDERRKHTKENRPEWGVHPNGKKKEYLAHYHADASRVMVKRFLVEFWKAGWLAEGLEVPSKPYPVAILGHDEEPDIVPYELDEE